MEKIKQFIQSDTGKDILIILIVILVGLAAFILGRISAQNTGINIQYNNIPASAAAGGQEASRFLEMNPSLNRTTSTADKAFFASKKGQKYYPLDCGAGKNIKPENRIYFKDNNSAESAGYELSTACD